MKSALEQIKYIVQNKINLRTTKYSMQNKMKEYGHFHRQNLTRFEWKTKARKHKSFLQKRPPPEIPVFNPGDLKKARSAFAPWIENWNLLVVPLLRTLFKLVSSPCVNAKGPLIIHWVLWPMILLAASSAC